MAPGKLITKQTKRETSRWPAGARPGAPAVTLRRPLASLGHGCLLCPEDKRQTKHTQTFAEQHSRAPAFHRLTHLSTARGTLAELCLFTRRSTSAASCGGRGTDILLEGRVSDGTTPQCRDRRAAGQEPCRAAEGRGLGARGWENETPPGGAPHGQVFKETGLCRQSWSRGKRKAGAPGDAGQRDRLCRACDAAEEAGRAGAMCGGPERQAEGSPCCVLWLMMSSPGQQLRAAQEPRRQAHWVGGWKRTV